MKYKIAIAAFTCLSIQLFAQTYPCENSRVGKLVTKTLLKKGKIHYEDAVTDSKNKVSSSHDFTSINVDSVGNSYIARHHAIDKIQSVDLLFVSDKKTGKCTYQVTLLTLSGASGIRLNENGEVIKWDENETLTEKEKSHEQQQADEWLKYFE